MLRCDNKNTPTPPQAINNDRSLNLPNLILSQETAQPLHRLKTASPDIAMF